MNAAIAAYVKLRSAVTFGHLRPMLNVQLAARLARASASAWTRAGLADFAEPAGRSLEGEERHVVQAAILGAGHVRREDLDDEHLGEELDPGRQQVARVRDG